MFLELTTLARVSGPQTNSLITYKDGVVQGTDLPAHAYDSTPHVDSVNVLCCSAAKSHDYLTKEFPAMTNNMLPCSRGLDWSREKCILLMFLKVRKINTSMIIYSGKYFLLVDINRRIFRSLEFLFNIVDTSFFSSFKRDVWLRWFKKKNTDFLIKLVTTLAPLCLVKVDLILNDVKHFWP